MSVLLCTAIFLVQLNAAQEAQVNIEDLNKKATAGDLNAAEQLGVCYIKGLSVEKNDEKGLMWIMIAAKGGKAGAQGILGMAYLTGQGTLDVNKGEAVKWLKLSADQGFLPAEKSLGQCYIKGDGVAKNVELGVEYITKAALAGDDSSQLLLSEYYRAGKIVPEDKKKGLM